MALTTSLISYWKFDETSGTSAADSAGTATGTLKNQMSFTSSGKINYGVIQSSTSSGQMSVSIGANATIDAVTTFPLSISAWCKLTGNNGFVFTTTGVGGAGGYLALFYTTNDGKIQMTFSPNSGTTKACIDPSTSNDGNWHHFVGTISGAGLITLYRDGSSVNTLSGANGSLLLPALTNIGGNWDNNDNPFLGSIDEVGFWNRELTSGEVTQLYNSGAGLQYPFTTANNKAFLAFM